MEEATTKLWRWGQPSYERGDNHTLEVGHCICFSASLLKPNLVKCIFFHREFVTAVLHLGLIPKNNSKTQIKLINNSFKNEYLAYEKYTLNCIAKFMS